MLKKLVTLAVVFNPKISRDNLFQVLPTDQLIYTVHLSRHINGGPLAKGFPELSRPNSWIDFFDFKSSPLSQCFAGCFQQLSLMKVLPVQIYSRLHRLRDIKMKDRRGFLKIKREMYRFP